MVMPGRKYTAGTGYRYGFNGKEEDDEVKGDGNQQDYGMRIYDTRLGRFLSVDPITKQYPELTPFQFASNSPIENIDVDGLERYNYRLILDKDGKTVIKIQNEKIIKDRFEDWMHGERHRVIDPKSSLLLEFEFRSEAELNKFVTGRSVDELRQVSDRLIQQGIFFSTMFITAHELEKELINIGMKLGKKQPTSEDVPKTNEAHNAASYEKLQTRLRTQERTSILKENGTLRPEVIKASSEIMNGSQLNNKSLINNLTKDGSNIADWNKMSYIIKQQSPAGEKSIDIHYYYNSRTGATYFDEDYKTKLSTNYFEQTPKPKQ
jgi:RHS repeat-associated protein